MFTPSSINGTINWSGRADCTFPFAEAFSTKPLFRENYSKVRFSTEGGVRFSTSRCASKNRCITLSDSNGSIWVETYHHFGKKDICYVFSC